MSGQMSIQELLEKGVYHYGLGEIDKAIEFWQEVLRLDPENETAGEYIEIETGRKPEARPREEVKEEKEEILEPVAEVTQDLPDAPALADKFVEGQLLIQHEDWGEAVKAFEAAHRFDPSFPLYWTYVALARARLMKATIEKAGGLNSVISLRVPLTELIGKKNFTQEEGFVLSLISGDITLEEVISLSPIPRFQTYSIIHALLDDGLLKMEERRP